MAIKSQELPINYTFLIIIGITVTLVILGIIFLLKGNITSYISSIMPKYNSTQTVVETNVTSIQDVAMDVVSCYYKKSQGLCYLINYQGNPFTCQDLINNVSSIDPNVVMQNCNYNINPGEYILVYSAGSYVYINVQG
ncbi:MAG: hypothetical protein RXO65_00155 [Candidatus Nanopusillus acidilobi]